MNDQTREAVLEWLMKARNDWATVEILLASGQAPGETTCFHCQQYVEKLVKAVRLARELGALLLSRIEQWMRPS
jgi:HEPN domain-containing protein